jgi:hypothetical protein
MWTRSDFTLKDRIVQYPNRYKLTQVSGDTYDLTPVPGNVTEQGTDLNKANLFPDDVAVALGLDPADNPQIKDGFMSLASRPMDELVLPPEYGLLYAGTTTSDITGSAYTVSVDLSDCSNAITVEIYTKTSDNTFIRLHTVFGDSSFVAGPAIESSISGETARLILFDVPGGILACGDSFNQAPAPTTALYIPNRRVRNITALGFATGSTTAEAGAIVNVYGRRL